MADNNDDAAAAAPAVCDVKLPVFWPSRPDAWFTLAESRFRLRQVTDSQQKFDHLLSALPDAVIAEILDVIADAEEQEDPYMHVKERLMETHALSDFEKLEQLYKCEPLGGRKPSQLLAAMLAFCPDGEEKGIFFHFMFLQRLPLHLRSMLGDVTHGDPRALAAKADRLLSLNPQSSTVAAVSEQNDPATASVAAVAPSRGRGRGGRQNQGRGRGGGARGGAQGGTQAGGNSSKTSPSPANLAQESSGLCYFHWTFGERANNCKGDCSWQGN
jgi:hypothetical protein